MSEDRLASVGEVVRSMDVPLAPRKRSCKVCRSVADVADVNARLFDAQGQRRRGYQRLAMDYLAGIGVAVSKTGIEGHTQHVIADLRRSRSAPPGKSDRLTPLGTPASWYDVTEAGMNLGMEALRNLNARLGELEPDQLIKIASLGVGVAGKRADIEARGKAVGATITAIAALASGHTGELEATVGNFKVRGRLGDGQAEVTNRHDD